MNKFRYGKLWRVTQWGIIFKTLPHLISSMWQLGVQFWLKLHFLKLDTPRHRFCVIKWLNLASTPPLLLKAPAIHTVQHNYQGTQGRDQETDLIYHAEETEFKLQFYSNRFRNGYKTVGHLSLF